MLYLIYGQFFKFGYTNKNRSVAIARCNAYEFLPLGGETQVSVSIEVLFLKIKGLGSFVFIPRPFFYAI